MEIFQALSIANKNLFSLFLKGYVFFVYFNFEHIAIKDVNATVGLDLFSNMQWSKWQLPQLAWYAGYAMDNSERVLYPLPSLQFILSIILTSGSSLFFSLSLWPRIWFLCPISIFFHQTSYLDKLENSSMIFFKLQLVRKKQSEEITSFQWKERCFIQKHIL